MRSMQRSARTGPDGLWVREDPDPTNANPLISVPRIRMGRDTTVCVSVGGVILTGATGVASLTGVSTSLNEVSG
jgi:hypothetical protein